MGRIKSIIKRLLARRNYVLEQELPEIAPSIKESLLSIKNGASSDINVLCIDNEVRMQSEILEVFPTEQIQFATPLQGSPASAQPSQPQTPFLSIVDADAFHLDSLFQDFNWLTKSTQFWVCARIGSFATENQDASTHSQFLKGHGLILNDVLIHQRHSLIQSSSNRVVFKYCKAPSQTTPAQKFRCNEALTFLSTPLASKNQSTLLAGRGSYGFKAGVFNPGAIKKDGKIQLLARAEKTPWYEQKHNSDLFYSSPEALLLTLDSQRNIEKTIPVKQRMPSEGVPLRTEDFRLFEWKGETYSNHAILSDPEAPSSSNQKPIAFSNLNSTVAISKFDTPTGELSWQAYPTLDRKTQRIEKNWAFFSEGEELYLLYSTSPYMLFKAEQSNPWHFNCILESEIDLPIFGDGIFIRNSINPIAYDDSHFLHIVHKVYPNKTYTYWALLINKTSLFPTKISSRPLISNHQSRTSSICYLSSAVLSDHKLELFNGLDDSSLATIYTTRETLDKNWAPLPSSSGR